MPLPFLAMIGLGAVAAAAVVACWDEIVDWLSEVVSAVKRFFVAAIHATAAFIQKVRSAVAKMMHRVYYKEDNQWIEETTTRTIDESELPPSIRRKLKTQETEVTEELEAMGLEV